MRTVKSLADAARAAGKGEEGAAMDAERAEPFEMRVEPAPPDEVPARRVGEMVMRELRRLDHVGYIRFASVYRSFQGIDDFRDAIKEVQKPGKRPTNRKGARREE